MVVAQYASEVIKNAPFYQNELEQRSRAPESVAYDQKIDDDLLFQYGSIVSLYCTNHDGILDMFFNFF